MLRVFVLKCLTLYHSIGGTKYNLWAEQTVARRKTKFLKKLLILAIYCIGDLPLMPQKNWRLYEVLLY